MDAVPALRLRAPVLAVRALHGHHLEEGEEELDAQRVHDRGHVVERVVRHLLQLARLLGLEQRLDPAPLLAELLEEVLPMLEDLEDRFHKLLLVSDVPLDEEPSLLPLPLPLIFFCLSLFS
mgnify:CR=1 FL=1